MINRANIPILLIPMILLISGCVPKPASIGDEGGLVIVADELDRPLLQGQVAKTFGKAVITPQDEPLFDISWIDAGLLESNTRSPLLLLAAPLDGTGKTAAYLRGMLSGEVLEGVKSGEYFLFQRQEPWSKRQRLMILTGRNSADFAQNAIEWMDTLEVWGRSFELERLAVELFTRGENKNLEGEIKRRYGFSLRIQHDYQMAQHDDSLHYLRLIRHGPERWLLIAWREKAAGDSLTPQMLYEWRKSLGAHFLDPVQTYDENWKSDSTTISGRDALLLRGLWQTIDPTGGGPFFTYGFEVPEENRYYILDGAVFAPGKKKMPFLWQLETIAGTFRPVSDTKGMN